MKFGRAITLTTDDAHDFWVRAPPSPGGDLLVRGEPHLIQQSVRLALLSPIIELVIKFEVAHAGELRLLETGPLPIGAAAPPNGGPGLVIRIDQTQTAGRFIGAATYNVPSAERMPTGSAPRVNECAIRSPNESFSQQARHRPIGRRSEKPKNTSGS
jgi:hypothetical protein